MATDTETKTSGKAKTDKLAYLAGPLVVSDLVEPRKPWGGLPEKEANKALEAGQHVYFVDESALRLDLDRNGRIEHGEEAMVNEIYKAGGIIEPLTINVPKGTTLADLQTGKVMADALRGNRRTLGIRLIRARDTKWFSENLEGRIPVKIVHVTPGLEEMRYRHDQAGQRGLSKTEVYKQAIDMIRQGFGEKEVSDTLFESYRTTSDNTKPMDELDVDYENGKVTFADMVKRRRSWAHGGLWQMAQELAALPSEAYQHYIYQNHPRVAAKAGYDKIGVTLTREDIKELYKISSTPEVGKKLAKDRFDQMMETKVNAKNSGGTGGNEDSGDRVGKSMSKADLERLAKMYTSETLPRIMLAIAGDMGLRKELPAYDLLLAKLELAQSRAPEAVRCLFDDIERFVDLTETIDFKVAAVS